MILTLEVTPDLELELRREADRQGVDAKSYVLGLLQGLLTRPRPSPEAQSDGELLATINLGLSPDQWQRYRELKAKRRAENLTEDEHAELIATTHKIEEDNVYRVRCLAELARRRQTSMQALMDVLGIQPAIDG